MVSIVVLAAGRGTRMRSTLPKMLQPIAGRALLDHILHTASQLNPQQLIVVCGSDGERLQSEMQQYAVEWVTQSQPLGTAHAVLQVLPHIRSERVLIWYGDIPLTQASTLDHFLNSAPQSSLGLMTARVEYPTGLGRIVRDKQGRCVKIVEEKEATSDELKLQEINTGFFLVSTADLKRWIPEVVRHNHKHECYLTDLVEMASKEGKDCFTATPEQTWEVLGVNDKVQLAQLERSFQRHQAEQLMQAGVTLSDPTRLDIRGQVTVGTDVTIDVNVVLIGQVILGDRVSIGPHVIIKDSVIGDGACIASHTIIEEAEVGTDCRIGPFARIRPETVLSEKVQIGNFVEVKKSTLGKSSKANHLSYIGDATIGAKVNIGAGVITCNYDGQHKHQTIIGDGVFVGSDSQLIAPLVIQSDVIIGAGTTVTRDIAQGMLVHNRIEHRVVSQSKSEEVKD